MMRIRFDVPAVPVAQPRPRAVNNGGHARIHEATHVKGADGVRREHPIVAFKATVRHAAALAYQGPPLTEPLEAELVFVMPRPKTLIWKRKPMLRLPHVSTPDVDNIAKAVFDSLNERVFVNDSQVWKLTASKFIAAGDEQPHVEVTLQTLEVAQCG